MLNKKAVMIIAPIEFRDEELFETREVLEAAGVAVTIASTITSECIGMLKGSVKPDMLIMDVRVNDFDAFILVGGIGSSCYWNDSIMHKIIIDAVALNKVVGAICIAPVTLAYAGVLEGKRVTCWKSEQGKIVSKGAIYTGARVTYDGNIITADGPTSATQFGRSLVKAFEIM
ncbi:MAG: DJ-1/PfpI family protein [Candidatus Omnitrophica bacterium]|nr:DJ-1/PfpI family protein [Candidatus Omnitrophota bacterium]